MLKLPAPLRRTWSIAKKELIHIWLDPGTLFLVVVAPAILLMLFAYIFTFDAGDSNITVVDLDQSPSSAAYLRSLTADGHLHLVGEPRGYDDAVQLLEAGRADAAIIIPPGFGAAVSAGSYVQVHNVVDGVDAGSARRVMSAIQIRTRRFTSGTIPGIQPPIEVRLRVWFNENMSSQHSMVPGLMSLVLVLPAMAVALGITREKESGTLETLVTTPVLGADVLIGKVLVYLFLGILSALFALFVARLWFRVPFRGSLLLWILATACYLLACMAFSLLVAHFARTQQTAMVIILVMLFIPGFMLSGLSDPIDPGSIGTWVFAQMLPMTHYITVSREIYLKALPLSAMWFDIAALAVMGVVGIIIAITFFEKKIA